MIIYVDLKIFPQNELDLLYVIIFIYLTCVILYEYDILYVFTFPHPTGMG